MISCDVNHLNDIYQGYCKLYACYNPGAITGFTKECVRHKYARAPVSQVVCEFQFNGANPWDWTIPGLIYQKIHNEFPEKRQESAFEIKITPQEQRVEKTFPGSLSKMQFVSADSSTMVQIGPDLLAVNILKDYPGWERFRELIRKQFEVYCEIANPVSYKRLGLRFINTIDFSSPAIEIIDYFNYYPHLPASIEQAHGPFTMHVFPTLEGDRDALGLRMGTIVPITHNNVVIVLDLDYYLVRADQLALNEGPAWIERAHESIETIFESCITDKARALFAEVK